MKQSWYTVFDITEIAKPQFFSFKLTRLLKSKTKPNIGQTFGKKAVTALSVLDDYLKVQISRHLPSSLRTQDITHMKMGVPCLYLNVFQNERETWVTISLRRDCFRVLKGLSKVTELGSQVQGSVSQILCWVQHMSLRTTYLQLVTSHQVASRKENSKPAFPNVLHNHTLWWWYVISYSKI